MSITATIRADVLQVLEDHEAMQAEQITRFVKSTRHISRVRRALEGLLHIGAVHHCKMTDNWWVNEERKEE